jgi:hypothetical protein
MLLFYLILFYSILILFYVVLLFHFILLSLLLFSRYQGNIVLFPNNQVLPFDCLEFNSLYRTIDVLNDVAFACVDLGEKKKNKQKKIKKNKNKKEVNQKLN